MNETKILVLTQRQLHAYPLVGLLNRHDEIHCDANALKDKVESPMQYIQESLAKVDKPGYGFTTNYWHLKSVQELDPRAFLADMYGDGWRIIYIQRFNIFDHALERLISEAKVELSPDADETQEPIKVTIDPETLLKKMQQLRYQTKMDKELLQGIPYLTLYRDLDFYADTRYQLTADRVFGYLGIPSINAKIGPAQNTQAQLVNQITNYDEVVAFIRERKALAHFLE